MSRSKRPTKNSGADKEDLTWIFSYADLMSLLVCFVIILLSMANMDAKKMEEFTKQLQESFNGKEQAEEVELSEMQKQLRAYSTMVQLLGYDSDLSTATEKIEKLSAAAIKQKWQEVVGSTDKEGKAYEPKIWPKEQKMYEFILPNSLLFSSGSANIKPDIIKELKSIAERLKKNKDIEKIEIIGHTDSRPVRGGVYKNNFGLSSARAGAIAGVLVKNGLSDKKFIVSGMGSQSPLFPNKDKNGNYIKENLQKNRRVHLIVHFKEKKNATKTRSEFEQSL